MSTSSLFTQLLNEYLPQDLLRDEILRRGYFFNTLLRDEGWTGASIAVPIRFAGELEFEDPMVGDPEPPTQLTEAGQQFENALDLALGDL
jgi:hypothetical protein